MKMQTNKEQLFEIDFYKGSWREKEKLDPVIIYSKNGKWPENKWYISKYNFKIHLNFKTNWKYHLNTQPSFICELFFNYR